MKDDLLDMTADERSLGKPVGNDLTERKMTIPLIEALAAGDGIFRARSAVSTTAVRTRRFRRSSAASSDRAA